MVIEKKEIINIKDDDGNEIKIGSPVCFVTNYGTMIGVFGGINSNGSLIFKPYIEGLGKTMFFRIASVKNIRVLK